MSRFKQVLKTWVSRGTGIALGFTGLVVITDQSCQAGVMNIPHFVTQGEFAVGIEPEFQFGNNSQLGMNLRYTHGLSEMNNVVGILGTGGGDRQFQMGGAFTFDFFPDYGQQPGIGVALQGLFVQYSSAAALEVSAIPYIHKSFSLLDTKIEPFLALPTGLSLSDGRYQNVMNLSLGSMIEHSANFRSVLELGINLAHSNPYFSGGITYYH